MLTSSEQRMEKSREHQLVCLNECMLVLWLDQKSALQRDGEWSH